MWTPRLMRLCRKYYQYRPLCASAGNKKVRHLLALQLCQPSETFVTQNFWISDLPFNIFGWKAKAISDCRWPRRHRPCIKGDKHTNYGIHFLGCQLTASWHVANTQNRTSSVLHSPPKSDEKNCQKVSLTRPGNNLRVLLLMLFCAEG